MTFATVQHHSLGVDDDQVLAPESIGVWLQRRLSGRAPLDPFGLDASLSDAAAPLLRATVRVDVHGAHHIPQSGPAVLAMNRGLGVFEPTALTVAVMNATGRRARVVGAPGTIGIGATLRRFGAIAASPADVRAALDAQLLVVVPLATTWLAATGSTPPLELMQAAMGAPVVPVSVRPAGPLGLPIAGWRVVIGEPVNVDSTVVAGDPLGAAELIETVRTAVDNLR